MSAIATFTVFLKAKLDGLREAATPRKRLFREPKDSYDEYIGEHGRQAFDYEWSGYLLATLLPYFKQRHNIDLMRSEYSELDTFCRSNAERHTSPLPTNTDGLIVISFLPNAIPPPSFATTTTNSMLRLKQRLAPLSWTASVLSKRAVHNWILIL